MILISRSVLPVSVDVVDQSYVNLFSLSGGHRFYGMDASDRNVKAYLPPATTGTRLVFFRADDGSSGCHARLYPRTTVTLNGSTTVYIDLYDAGSAVEVVPNADLTGWITCNRVIGSLV